MSYWAECVWPPAVCVAPGVCRTGQAGCLTCSSVLSVSCSEISLVPLLSGGPGTLLCPVAQVFALNYGAVPNSICHLFLAAKPEGRVFPCVQLLSVCRVDEFNRTRNSLRLCVGLQGPHGSPRITTDQ